MAERICPVCQAQLELSADGLYDVCPVCGYSRLRTPDTEGPAPVSEGSEVLAEVPAEEFPQAPAEDLAAPLEEAAAPAEPAEPPFPGEEPAKAPEETGKKKITFREILGILKRVGIVLAGLILLALIIFGAVRLSHRGEIRTGVSANDIVGQNYQVAEAQLKEIGFTNVKVVEKLDLGMGDAERFKTVSQVSIDGNISFKKRSWFTADAPVIITYHDLDPARKNDVRVPENSKAYVGQNYSVVLAKLQAAGFTNIALQPVYDLSFFSRGDAGQVDRVLLDPDVDLSAGDWVSNDTLIKIYYHERRSKSSDAPLLAEDELLTTCAAKDLRGENVDDAVSVLKKQGFTNVTVTPLKDLKKSSKKDGKVDSVSINGDTSFKKGVVCPKNAEVIVSHHSVRDAEE